MIIGCNNEITEVHYSGYTIDKIYACGGQLVYEKTTPRTGLTYTATAKANVVFGRFTPTATAETFSEGNGTIEFSEPVTEIGESAFDSKAVLLSVYIPDSVTSIGKTAFQECENLTGITIGSGVTLINNYAFYWCTKLTNVTIPSGVTSIGRSAFNHCSSLTSITVNAITPPTLGSTVFDNTNNCPIYVPSGSVSTYQSAWSAYASRIQAIP